MCSQDKCCFFFRSDLACYVVGIISMIFSGIIITTAAVFLALGNPDNYRSALQNTLQDLQVYLSVSPGTIKIVLWVVIAVAVISIIASAALMIGLRKRLPGFLLFHFSFNVFLTIVTMLGALLLLLEKHWQLALGLFGISLGQIHFLVVVHALYEGLQRGKVYSFSPHTRLDDEEQFIINAGVEDQ